VRWSALASLALAGLLGLAACGGTTVDPDTAASETTVESAGRRVPTASDPLRVMVVGDSVTGELALPIEAALETGGHGRVEYVTQPTLPRDPTYRTIWEDALGEHRPDLVIVMIGYWEQRDLEAWTVADLPDAATYQEGEVEPFLRSATAAGAEVLWIGAPPIADPAASAVFAELDRRYAAVASTEPGVDHLGAASTVTAWDGSYVDVLPGPNGPERVRVTDGLHLCPAGSVRMAQPVLAWITARWDVPLGVGWEQGAWRTSPFSGAEGCPPV